jgi:hypothetical protein
MCGRGVHLLSIVVLAFPVASADAAISVDWLTQYGTAYSDIGRSIARDSAGNLWVSGSTNGKLGSSGSAGRDDIALIRVTAQGSVDFATQHGGQWDDDGYATAIVGTGTVFALGVGGGANGSGVGSFDGQAIIGNNDAVAIGFATDGTWLGTTRFGSLGNDYLYGAAGNSANLLTVGLATYPMDGQAGPDGEGNAFISKRDAAGNLVWTRLLGSSDRGAGTAVNTPDIGEGAAFDNSGNEYVCGQAAGSLPGFKNAGNTDAFVAKYDASGNRVLVTEFGTALDDVARAVKIDATGNIYLAGDYTPPGANFADGFVTKLDSSGKILWQETFGGTGADYSNAIDLDNQGHIFVAGVTSSTFGGHSLRGGSDGVLLEYDTDGNLLDSFFLDGPNSDEIDGLTVGPDGSIYVSGETSSTLGATNYGGEDMFVAKLSIVPEPSSLAALCLLIGAISNLRHRAKNRAPHG